MGPIKHGIRALKEELKNITTLNFIANTKNVLEKIVWAMIAICGTLFIYDVVYIQLQNWRDNPTLVTKENRRLSDMPLPSVTFCHKGLQKYGPVEQLSNLIDPEKNVPNEIVAIRNEFLKVEYQKMKGNLDGINFCDWHFNMKEEHYMQTANEAYYNNCKVDFCSLMLLMTLVTSYF